MKYYFEDKQKQDKLLGILESWIGTPYRHRAGVKGMGCDCVHLPIGVLTEMGLMKVRKKDVPHYAPDYHMHKTRSMLVDSIAKHLSAEEITDGSFMNGDILCFSFGKTAAHAGFWFNDYLYEAVDRIGVIKTHFPNSQWREKLQHTYRILI